MGTVEGDLARYESEVARAEAKVAARERAVLVEMQRLSDLTVAELLRETDVVSGLLREFSADPHNVWRCLNVALDINAIVAFIAERNVENVKPDAGFDPDDAIARHQEHP